MRSYTPARAQARALAGAFAVGATLSAFLGGAYLAGGSARAAADQSVALRLAKDARSAFTAGRRQAGLIRVSNDGAAPAQVAPGSNPSLLIAQPVAADLPPALAAGARAGEGLSAPPFHAQASGRDADCLTTAVYYEARGEGQPGQAAVAQVILNRVRSPAYPKSICGVVFQGCQFSFACNGAMRGHREAAAWSRARRIADRALDGFVMTTVGAATNFHASRVAPSWGGMVRVAQVGAHVFYRFGGRPSFSREPSRDDGHGRLIRVADDAASAPAYRVLGPSSRPSQARLMLASNIAAPPANPAARGATAHALAAAQMALPAPSAMSTTTTKLASAS